jgi:hypothetical protein
MSQEIFQNHHVIERRKGGSDDPTNIQRVTRVEHALIHFGRFHNLKGTEAEFEFDAVVSQFGTMGEDERQMFNDELKKRYKVNVRFL